jgi:DNA-binding response OmpR family regulator
MMPASRRTALLIGFPKGLEEAISVVLASSHFAVTVMGSAAQAMELLAATPVDLLVASGRCSPGSIVKLTQLLGERRKTRIIVLLAGHDQEAERRYREAGIQYVLHMPVNVDDLLGMGDPARRGQAR